MLIFSPSSSKSLPCLLVCHVNFFFLKAGYDLGGKSTKVNGHSVGNFMFICLGISLCLLFVLGKVSEAKISDMFLFLSPIFHLDLHRDFHINKI